MGSTPFSNPLALKAIWSAVCLETPALLETLHVRVSRLSQSPPSPRNSGLSQVTFTLRMHIAQHQSLSGGASDWPSH